TGQQDGQQRVPASRSRARGARRAHRGGPPRPHHGDEGMIDIDAILKELVTRRGSDLHLKVNRPPLMRISSDLLPSEFPPLTSEDMEGVLRKLVGDRGWTRLTEDYEVDASYEIQDVARFRLNAFKERERYGAALRVIPLT